MLNYQIVTFGGSSTVSLFHGGQAYIANDSHPHWDKIIAALLAQDESVVDLFDLADTVGRKFQRLTENITVENGVICLYGDPVDNSLSRKALEFLEAGVDDWKPLVNFYENCLSNPEQESIDQMYRFLSHNNFAITEDGLIVGYKGVYKADPQEADNVGGRQYRSARSGASPVSVNDEEPKAGYVYQSVGDTVSMARSLVDNNRNQACGQGLHVSTYQYAKSYGDGVVEVHFHPRDLVSVPNEVDFHKCRVNRYTITRVVDEPFAGLVQNPTTLEASPITVARAETVLEDDPWGDYDDDESSWSWEEDDSDSWDDTEEDDTPPASTSTGAAGSWWNRF
jgi:hypothetical protein